MCYHSQIPFLFLIRGTLFNSFTYFFLSKISSSLTFQLSCGSRCRWEPVTICDRFKVANCDLKAILHGRSLLVSLLLLPKRLQDGDVGSNATSSHPTEIIKTSFPFTLQFLRGALLKPQLAPAEKSIRCWPGCRLPFGF